MTDTLNVLTYGSIDTGSCNVVRAGMFRAHLLALGVTLRSWTELSVEFPDRLRADPLRALETGEFEIDRSAVDWADVIVFRRLYYTRAACLECDSAWRDEAEAQRHALATGHAVRGPRDRLLRPLWRRILEDPSFLAGKGILYDTDDNLLEIPDWSGEAAAARLEADLVESMLGRADLVTVSTPPLEQLAGQHNRSVRLIRNAVEPVWYQTETPSPPSDEIRLLFYGVAARIRDYAVCGDAVADVARADGRVRRIWLGSAAPVVLSAVDEAIAYVPGPQRFAHLLAQTAPHVGLAPIGADPFNRSRSELHWLEYSMAGAATIATRFDGPGPYDPIRDGVDGILARSKRQWRDGLRALTRSDGLRREIAGRARERVLLEYRAADRAREWADAYRWAAEHQGSGAGSVGD